MNRRRYLTGKEVQAMMLAARHGATGERDYCLILLAFRHGMRISELLDLHYRDLDLNEGRINIRRLKTVFPPFIPCVLMSVRPLNAGVRSAQTGEAQAVLTPYLSPAGELRFLANRRIVLFVLRVLMPEPSPILTPICYVTPVVMNLLKGEQIRD